MDLLQRAEEKYYSSKTSNGQVRSHIYYILCHNLRNSKLEFISFLLFFFFLFHQKLEFYECPSLLYLHFEQSFAIEYALNI